MSAGHLIGWDGMGVQATEILAGANISGDLKAGCRFGRIRPNILLMGFKRDGIRTDHPALTTTLAFYINPVFEASPERGVNTCVHPCKLDPDAMVTEPQLHTVFQSKQGEKTIDGSMMEVKVKAVVMLLLPYLLTRKKRWARCKVRVFVGGDIQRREEQRKDVRRFEDLIGTYKLNTDQKDGHAADEPGLSLGDPSTITLNEVLQDYSRNAAIIVVYIFCLYKPDVFIAFIDFNPPHPITKPIKNHACGKERAISQCSVHGLAGDSDS
ncbi:unnamed protein product [Coregonus sp. 'balchen']|nr:unnamed protein product [Coregonus sp. 'balchen']